MANVHGYSCRVLHVDAGSGRSVYRDLPESDARGYLGGVGLAARLLFQYAPPGADPLSPPSALVIAAAPLVGTAVATTAKFAVAVKSPLTGFVSDSLASGRFAIALKRAGLDALVITGRAPALAYLFVDGGTIELRDARGMAGRPAADAEEWVRADLGCPSASVAAVGPAGERAVRFATISTEGRHAGRGGAGAVMGAKDLKAIAIAGRQPITVVDPRRLDALADALRSRTGGPATDTYRGLGTVARLSVFNRLGLLPTRNFLDTSFDEAASLTGETLAATSAAGRVGCAGCTIACEHRFRSPRTREQRLEYETVFALGPLCGVADADCVIDAAALCDRYGLDAVSTGGTLAWAMEAAERAVLPEAARAGLRFGRGDALLAAIQAIAERSGIGDLLAEGSRRAAAATGNGSDAWAMHVKGLELPGYDPRRLRATALGLAVNPRGACHNRSGAHDADFSADPKTLHDPGSIGEIVAACEDKAAILDSSIVCRFARGCFQDFYGETADMLSAVTGWNCPPSELRMTGERIHTLKKVFNLREGWVPSDDWLPERLLSDPGVTPPSQRAGVSRDELRDMIRGYYRARQWDEHGLVPEGKLRELAIDLQPAEAAVADSRCTGRVTGGAVS